MAITRVTTMPLLLEDVESCACCPPRRMSAAKQMACYRTSKVRPGASLKTLKLSRDAIRRDMVRMRRILMHEGGRSLASLLHSYFAQKIEELADRMNHHIRHSSTPLPMVKGSVDLGFGSHEAIWQQALKDVLGPDADIELVADYLPAVQSVAAKAYSRTSVFLGEGEDPQASVFILRRAQALAQQVTRINETTRRQLSAEIGKALDNDMTVAETVSHLRETFPDIAASRIPTIARTEMGRAVDEGTKQAMKESSVVSHCDVVGCQAVEPGIPTYMGRPTCNITDVPVYDLDKLQFHINHTGCIVAGKFHGE